MKKIYRIYALGDIPRGLSEQVSKLHAFAVSKYMNGEDSPNFQASNRQNTSKVQNAARSVHQKNLD